jgi:hypothetical protein
MAQLPKIMPKSREMTICLAGFSRKGWTESASKYARELIGGRSSQWRVTAVKLLAFEDLDRDLAAWATQSVFDQTDISR